MSWECPWCHGYGEGPDEWCAHCGASWDGPMEVAPATLAIEVPELASWVPRSVAGEPQRTGDPEGRAEWAHPASTSGTGVPVPISGAAPGLRSVPAGTVCTGNPGG